MNARGEQQPAAVLWDMDGTVVDSEPLWDETETAMLARYGVEMTAEIRAQLVGSGLTAATQLFQRLGVPLTTEEMLADWARHVCAGLREGRAEWRPGALELLRSLGEAGIPSALVTMSVRPIADAMLELLPEGTFVASVAGDEVEYEKPHADPYLRGAALLGVSIEECVAIEDSPTGLRAAHSSGAVAIGVPHLVALDEAPHHELWPTLAGVDAARLSERFGALAPAGLPLGGAR